MLKVKFDGKHWIGKRTPKGPLKIHSYNHVVQQASKALGRGGIVAVPNARPDEYRFEELKNFGRGDIISAGGSGIFQDFNKNIYFIKAQEINTYLEGIPLTFLAYNLPYGENLSDKNADQVLQNAQRRGCILGITAPSCIKNLEKAFEKYPELPGHLDFFVGWSGGAKDTSSNQVSYNFYNEHLQGKRFEHPFSGEIHKIGVTAVSGGHRCPKGVEKVISSPTIGSNYIEIPALEDKGEKGFIIHLKKSLRESCLEGLPLKMNCAETYLRHAPSLFIFDKIRKLFGKY